VTLPIVHCTAEHGKRFVPLTVKGKAAAPAVALVCEMEIFAGAGGDDAEIVKASMFERTPELDT
jgi:hypothetical protein